MVPFHVPLFFVSRLITFVLISDESKIYANLFLLFSIVLTRKISYVSILDSTCRYSFDKCHLETKEALADTLEIEDFSSSNPRTCSSLRSNLPFGLWKSLTELEEKFCWFKGAIVNS